MYVDQKLDSFFGIIKQIVDFSDVLTQKLWHYAKQEALSVALRGVLRCKATRMMRQRGAAEVGIVDLQAVPAGIPAATTVLGVALLLLKHCACACSCA